MKNGIIPINKPEGLSSAGVVAGLKKRTQARKVGHMGTLDPFATGLLLCGVNRGTRLSRFFLGGPKRYRGTIHLGYETDTLDSTGKIVKEKKIPAALTRERVIETVKEFKGEQKQIPPVFSALKHKGRPLYKYAREGERIEKPARTVEVFDISVKNIDFPFVHIDVCCSAGTYVRTLSYDIGKKLGCGASLYALCREESSGFHLKDAVDFSSLEKMRAAEIERRIIPLSECLHFFPGHLVDGSVEKKIRSGMKIDTDDGLPIPQKGNFLKIVDQNGNLAAVVEYDRHNKRFNYCCVFSA